MYEPLHVVVLADPLAGSVDDKITDLSLNANIDEKVASSGFYH
jgi:hypothetical protein